MMMKNNQAPSPSRLSPAQQARLQQRLQGQNGHTTQTILPRLEPGPTPLSFAQQRLWFLDRLEPGQAIYNIAMATRARGNLDSLALERSLAAIVSRHETLRTTFTVIEEQPFQVINPAPTAPILTQIDLRSLPVAEREAQAHHLAQEEAQRPFDLVEGPLFRATLLHLDDQETFFLLTLHHIIADGWSIGILYYELCHWYTAHTTGEATPLPDLPIQYADFACWQREQLQGDRLAKHLAYWCQQLASAPPLLELPADRPRPRTQTYHGDIQYCTLSPDLSLALKTLSQNERVTLFMTLLATFQVLLSRYTGQEDLLIGSPIANRRQSQLESLIGFFVNTLALRTDLSGNPSFRQLLQRVRQVTLDAYAHQDVPFEKLVEALNLPRNLSYSPLFQVMFILQNAAATRLELPGVTFSYVSAESRTAKFDLTLNVTDDPQGFIVEAEYNRDLFEEGTINRLLGQYETLLRGILRDPDQPISQLPLLTAMEQTLLRQWNNQTWELQHAPIHHLFERQAEQTPAELAVVHQGSSLTYRQLNQQANQLAHALRAQGIGPDDRVALCLPRSLEMVIAVLGVLKAGAAYVPLDPSYPPARLSFMLSDSQARLLLTLPSVLADVPHAVPVVHLNEAFWQGQANTNPTPMATADHLLYVIYTSGSTGQPKGVALPHRALANLLAWQKETIPGRGRTLQFAPLSFDVSCQEMFSTWQVGGTLFLVDDEVRRDPMQLLAFLDEARIERLFLPFVALQHLAETAVQADRVPPPLHHVITAGEQLHITPAIRAWFQRLPACRLHNQYGPSETHVVTAYTLPPNPDEWLVLPSIGSPLPNTQIYILDNQQQLVPLGVPGELWIGGVHLARGYLNRPELTQERFIEWEQKDEGVLRHEERVSLEPFRLGDRGRLSVESQPDAGDSPPSPLVQASSLGQADAVVGRRGLLYRTGDLACWQADGTITYLGRVDQQVKVRGFRIEPGEIETVLVQHEAITEAVVVARTLTSAGEPTSSAAKQLVAYLVAAAPLQESQVRAYLQEQLPVYMLPTRFVFLDRLPLTPSGKVDRRALPVPEALRPDLALPFLSPRNPIEEVLATIWANLLGLVAGGVGVYDNFFALGGHSLLATQVMSRIQTTFQVGLPLRTLFEAPTIAELAERISDSAVAQQSMPPLHPAPRQAYWPLSYAQQRLWFLHQLDPDSPLYNLPAAMRLVGPLNIPALEQSLSLLIRRHESLRTRFGVRNGEPVQMVEPVFSFYFTAENMGADNPFWDLRTLPAAARESQARVLATDIANQPFDLGRLPLLRAALFRFDEEEYFLVLVMHHIIADGWSMGVFRQELAASYDAFCQLITPKLPDLAIQYTDFAYWQRVTWPENTLDSQLHYWRQQLAESPAYLNLPTDYPRPPRQSYRGAYRSRTLSVELTQALSQLSQRAGTTLYMTLLAAFNVLLYRYTGQTDILVGSPVANRHRPELEGLIGFFVNTLVMRTDLRGNPTFATLLARVREMALSAYANQDLPFEQLVEVLQPARSLSHSPLFQVSFLLLNESQLPVALPGLSIEPLDIPVNLARFDLTLAVLDDPDGLVASLEYNTDLFNAGTSERMLGHLEMILAAAAANPHQTIGQLPLLTNAEQQQLSNWNKTDNDYGSPLCLHELFERQVHQTPNAVALIAEDEQGLMSRTLTYQELDERANRLAHYLQGMGVGPDTVVGICVERSLAMAIGLFGILKAGGAYLPLDPDYPVERLAFMIADAQMPLLLTQHHLLDKLPADLDLSLICLDTDWSVIAPYPAHKLALTIDADQAAYVIYTSGSTGQPKGVINCHRGIYNHLVWRQVEYGLTSSDRVLQKTPFSFDVSVWEFFWTLATGACLVIARPGGHRDSDYLVQLIREQAITTIHFVPSMLQLFLEAPGLEQCRSLKRVFCGGETLSQDLRERFFARLEADLHNLYGPTEAAIDVTTWSCLLGDLSPGVPIGRPLANTQIHLLDTWGQPVPVGIPGELFIGGLHVARGYLNRPGLTATRFVPDPFANQPGARMYRTGDLARYRPDGAIEFLGRLDFQVKLRGFRIELGEIETALNQHPLIREAVVLVREDTPGDKRLVAYLVSTSGEPPAHSGLRSFLTQRLPEYTIPAAYVWLDALPLLANGKVNRQVLPPPDGTLERVDALLPPRTALEMVLMLLWQDMLNLSQVGVEDNFFVLGGHSLLAAQLIGQIRELFTVRLPLLSLFEGPTIAGLAEALLADPAQCKRIERQAELLLTLAQMSDEEANRRLAEYEIQL